jgi:hypothetical protein
MSHSKALPLHDPAVRGRPFSKGNGGRKPGSRNRASVIAASLAADEMEDLVRKGVELALAGDVSLIKFFLGRMLPRERVVELDLPLMFCADDAVAALGAVARLMSTAVISPSEGAAFATVINSTTRAMEIADVSKRLDEIEKRLEPERLDRKMEMSDEPSD